MKFILSRKFQYVYTLIILGFLSSSVASKVVKCKDNNGRIIYTDLSQKNCQHSKAIPLSKSLSKSSGPRNTIHVNPYTGTFKNNQTVARNIARIKAKADVALEKTLTRLGLKNNIDKIEIYVADAFKEKRPFTVITYTAKVKGEQRPVILFKASHLLFDSYDIEKKLMHELTHAVFRDSMKEKYSQLPKWFKEGIAVWVASQIENKNTYIVSSSVFTNEDPLLLINGIEGKHSLDDYLEDGLFFKYIEDEYGKQAVQTIVRSVIEGSTYQKALTSTLNLDWSTLKEKAYEYGLSYLEKRLAQSNYEKYNSIRKSSKISKVNWNDIKANYEGFIEQNVNSIFVPNAIYQLGKVNIRLKDYAKSRKHFETIVDHHSRYSLYDDSLYHIGATLMKEGEKELAKVQFDQLLTIYPQSNYKKIIDPWLKKK